MARHQLEFIKSPVWMACAIGLFAGAMPLKAAQEPLECKGPDSKIEIVGGVVFCTKTKKEMVYDKLPPCTDSSPETVFLYFTRPSFVVNAILSKAADIKCGGIVQYTGNTENGQAGQQAPDEPKSIIIYGDWNAKRQIKQMIAALDLPRDRITLDMWAIQISSASPARLASVMSEVQRQIEDTRDAMRWTYNEFVRLSQETPIGDTPARRRLNELGFSDLLPKGECNPDTQECIDRATTLSLTDMLIRLNFADNRIENYNRAALNICNLLVTNPKLKLFNTYEGQDLKSYDLKRIFNADPSRPFRRPFQNFMTVALHQDYDQVQGQPKCGDGSIPLNPDPQNPQNPQNKAAEEERVRRVKNLSFRRQEAVFDFARNYNDFRSYLDGRGSYDPDKLRMSTTALDSLIYPIVDAIQRDIENYFIRPTLFRIRQIVSRERDVEYAEVGRSTISGLNGLEVKAASKITTSFDEPTPLRLNQLLNDAAGINQNLSKLQPGLSNIPLGSSPAALSASSAISLAAALSKEESRWRSMDSGIDLTITPTVFQDRTAAELKVSMKIATDAQKSESKKDPSNPLRPLSRISDSTLDTKVYVNTMDLFALSSFNNQTTVSGRRWYIPLVGTMWEGAFGDIPVMGNLFSFKRPNQDVQHQSIILANTLIIPSAMGITSSYCGSTCQIPTACAYQIGKSCTPSNPYSIRPQSPGAQYQKLYPGPY